MAAELAGATWWINVGAYGCVALGLIMVVQTIFRQESADRLEWWRDRRHQRLAARKNAASTKP